MRFTSVFLSVCLTAVLDAISTLPAGRFSVSWDAKNDQGNAVASGVYFYRIKYNDLLERRKMVLLR